MAERQIKTPETTIFRRMGDELIVVQLDTAHYYYFNPETESFLNYFKTPQSISGYVEDSAIETKEAEYVKDFCRFLLEKNILQEIKGEHISLKKEVKHKRPVLLREGDKTLDEISFASP